MSFAALRLPFRQGALRLRPMAPLTPVVSARALHSSARVVWQHSSPHSNNNHNTSNNNHSCPPTQHHHHQQQQQHPQSQSHTTGPTASPQPAATGQARHNPLGPTPRPPIEYDAPRSSIPQPQPKRTFKQNVAGPAPPRGLRVPENDSPGRRAREADQLAVTCPMAATPMEEQAKPLQPEPEPEPEASVAVASATEHQAPATSAPEKEAEVPASLPSSRLVRTWTTVRDGVAHYYHGTKEMYRQTQISGQLIRRQLLGYDLTRRERGQLRRTRGDLLRLIPFVPFVIVPFAELLLPIAVKIFPRMLPSTFEPANAEAMRALRAWQARANAAQTVARVLSTHALPPSSSNPSALTSLAAVRAQPDTVNAATVIKAAQAFDEDSVLLSLPRPALIAMAQFLSLASTGSFSLGSAADTAASLGLSLDGYLRFLVRRRLTSLRSDDIVLRYSVKSTAQLDSDELRKATRERGIDLAVPMPSSKDPQERDDVLRTALHDWVLLHVEHRIAPTILVLASAITAAQGAPDPVPHGQTPRIVHGKVPEHLQGYPACLHTLLTHAPSGLDTRHPHFF